MSTDAAQTYVLPPALITRADVARLVREVESVDNEFEVQKVRDHREESQYVMPVMSRGLTEFLESNKVNIINAKERSALKDHLRTMKDKALIVHVTFATDADPETLQKLIDWLRTEIHPQAVLSVGLQPSLIGGMHMRTPNHIHDFTFRKVLAQKRDILVKELQALSSGTTQ